MTTTNENHLTSAALRFLRECVHFKNETGLAPGKADELLSMTMVNRWLKRNGMSWQIQVSSNPRGVDGTIVGDFPGPRSVEFKSSASKTSSYQFKPDFDYASHGCLVFTQLLDGVPNQIVLAIGTESVASIKKVADMDTLRLNFRPGDMALVHTTTRRPSKQRRDSVHGLLDLADKDDSIVVINREQLAELLAE